MPNTPQTNRTAALLLMLLAAFMVGTVVMSLEMLASRYLNPYFGGTIFTWAALISVVLLAMMSGYFIGGYSADKIRARWVLEAMIIIAALYLITLPYFIDPFLEAVVTTIEDVKLGALVGALLVTGLPVACLSTFTPIAIRRSLFELSHAGRISGTIFAISTAGNIFGTLLTSFYLIPQFGTRALTQSLSVLLVIAVFILICARVKTNKKGEGKRGVKNAVSVLFLAVVCLSIINKTTPANAKSEMIIEKQAGYPEGPVFIGGALYYTEMTRNRVMKLEQTNTSKQTEPAVFFYQRGCGPTSLARYQTDKILILCHLSDELVIVNKAGKTIRHIKQDKKGVKIFHPNDCIQDGSGGVYLSAPGHFAKEYQPMGLLFHVKNNGVVLSLASGLTYPNGVAIHKGELYVSEHLKGRVIKFPIKSDGTLGKFKIFTTFNDAPLFRNKSPEISGPDGIEISDDGTIYIAEYARGRILVYNTNGAYQKSIHTRLTYVTNIAIDKKKNHLIITGTNRLDTTLKLGEVYRRKIETDD